MSERATCVGCKERRETPTKGLYWCEKNDVGIPADQPRCVDFTPPIESYFKETRK